MIEAGPAVLRAAVERLERVDEQVVGPVAIAERSEHRR
jgi:hypothetical protein